jgi:aryl-alcohol dehydrogenase-like predicted oxidoreductase
MVRISTIQNQYSLINRGFEIGLSEIAIRESIGLLAYSPLSGGVLSGKYLDGAKPEGARFTLYTRNSERYNNPYVQEAVGKYVTLAKENGLDPSVMALAFCASQPFMTSVIIGTTSVEQVASDIKAGDTMLSEAVMQGIDEIYRMHPDPQS